MAGRSKKNCLTVERFFVRRREPVLVYRARICSSFLVKIKYQEHEIPNQVQTELRGGLESGVWGLGFGKRSG